MISLVFCSLFDHHRLTPTSAMMTSVSRGFNVLVVLVWLV
jgi:hypothetical protein